MCAQSPWLTRPPTRSSRRAQTIKLQLDDGTETLQAAFLHDQLVRIKLNGAMDFSNTFGVVVRDSLVAGSTQCQGAAALSTAPPDVFGGPLVLDPSDGKHYFTIDLLNVTGQDGRTEQVLGDNSHLDLQGVAHPDSTFTLCFAPLNAHSTDADFNVHIPGTKLFSQCATAVASRARPP